MRSVPTLIFVINLLLVCLCTSFVLFQRKPWQSPHGSLRFSLSTPSLPASSAPSTAASLQLQLRLIFTISRQRCLLNTPVYSACPLTLDLSSASLCLNLIVNSWPLTINRKRGTDNIFNELIIVKAQLFIYMAHFFPAILKMWLIYFLIRCLRFGYFIQENVGSSRLIFAFLPVYPQVVFAVFITVMSLWGEEEVQNTC